MTLNSGEGDTIGGVIVRGSVKEEIFMVIFMGSAGLTRNMGKGFWVEGLAGEKIQKQETVVTGEWWESRGWKGTWVDHDMEDFM